MEKEYLLWLVMALGAGNPQITELISRFGSGEAIYRAFRDNTALAGREAAERAASVTLEEARERLTSLEAREIRTVPIGGAFYPEPLKRLENPPCLLFVKGNVRLLSGKLLSTAGSRDITPYTLETQDRLCTRLCQKYTLVSSLSYGCDELSAVCALRARRPFVEILPCGFDHEYPDGSRVLRGLLLKNGGCSVTEQLPEAKPNQGAFLRRARIIGGISRALVIFQAGTQSGALKAAEYAGRVFFFRRTMFSRRSTRGRRDLSVRALPFCLTKTTFFPSIRANTAQIRSASRKNPFRKHRPRLSLPFRKRASPKLPKRKASTRAALSRLPQACGKRRTDHLRRNFRRNPLRACLSERGSARSRAFGSAPSSERRKVRNLRIITSPDQNAEENRHSPSRGSEYAGRQCKRMPPLRRHSLLKICNCRVSIVQTRPPDIPGGDRILRKNSEETRKRRGKDVCRNTEQIFT